MANQYNYTGKTVTVVIRKTGLSCVSYFADKQVNLQVIDTRENRQVWINNGRHCRTYRRFKSGMAVAE